MENKRVLLSISDLEVRFHVRGRILTAIRDISLDIYENESIAIVGESGSGKSVFTKAFAGMLDSNGFISKGKIIFSDEELSDTVVKYNDSARKAVNKIYEKLNDYSRLTYGADTFKKIIELKKAKEDLNTIGTEETTRTNEELKNLSDDLVDLINFKQTIDSKEKETIKDTNNKIDAIEKQIKVIKKQIKNEEKIARSAAKKDVSYIAEYQKKLTKLNVQYQHEIKHEITNETKDYNLTLAKEVYLSTGRFSVRKRNKTIKGLLEALQKANQLGVDITNEDTLNNIFDTVTFRVKYLDEDENKLHGTCVINLANITNEGDWTQIRGKKISTIFQDPMTSLNPIITIGRQITSIIIKHQKCSEVEARRKAIDLMHKVGIPNAEARFDDYPFQYSGGMRQRIVIAIALSCQPKILICDEPTTALDVTIQAQILKLIKDLQKEFNYTIVFITHDLGVVANIADRVAVLYAGQIVELGTVEEIFYEPKHPYTWALLSSLPQLSQKNTKLYSITGTPPSLYNSIVGDAFAPRNPSCLKIDTIKEPPMFKVSDTHFAKTWLLDERAPKINKPDIITDIHGTLIKAFNIQENRNEK